MDMGSGWLPVKWLVAHHSPFSLAEKLGQRLDLRTSPKKRHVAVTRQESGTPDKCGEPESKVRSEAEGLIHWEPVLGVSGSL